ncbi:MAG TPA: TIGR02996 domain-containing protein [Kofleriaceae bacterium]
MARYESDSQFREITRTGASITTRTGKLGNRGRATTKLYANVKAAERAFAELCVKQGHDGFALVESDPPATTDIAPPDEGADLEAAIEDAPYDVDGYLVYADALQRQGDPRGELIALQIAAERDDARPAVKTAPGKLLAKNVATLLGPLARHVTDVRDVAAPPFRWRHGFIHRVELASAAGHAPAALLDEVLGHPSGRFVVELAARCLDHAEATAVLATIERVHPPALRELDLHVQIPSGTLGALDSLWPVLDRLERIALVANSFELGDLALPATRRARFAARTMSESSTVAIAKAPWPVLERLELDLSRSEADFVDLQPLFKRDDLPALTHLKIRGCAFAGAITRALIDTAMARRLEVLDLSQGEINPGDAERMARAASSFPALRELWLPLDRLRAQDIEALKTVAKHVINERRAAIEPF